MTAAGLRIEGSRKELGGFHVARLLPHRERQMVGPFIFFDHIGPADFPPGTGVDVRPHPHIGLATVTWLFDGALRHRDSLGTVQDIGPGAVNWMTAGRGISHSERTPPAERAAGHRLHGIQTWVALPRAHEAMPAAFAHHPAASLPSWAAGGARLTLIAGAAFGFCAPVRFPHGIFYVEVAADAGARVQLPADHAERGVYVVEGAVTLDGGAPLAAGSMWILPDNSGAAGFTADAQSRVMLFGGAPMDGPRSIWWNLVASDPAAITAAKAAWATDPFGPPWGPIPDEVEFIPLPDA